VLLGVGGWLVGWLVGKHFVMGAMSWTEGDNRDALKCLV
jgi:hypothetical protein